MEIAAGFSHDFIYTAETKAWHLAETKQALPQQFYAIHTEIPQHLHSCVWRHLQRGQQEQQIPHDPALHVAPLNLRQPLLCDAADLQQPLRLLFQHLQRTGTKSFHDGLRRLAADTLQRPRGEIGQNTLHRRGQDLVPPLHRKLYAMFPINPRAFQLQFHRTAPGQIIAHSDEADQMVLVCIGTAGRFWNHSVRRFHL